MGIPVLLQRLTTQLTSQRSYCLFNLCKASRQQHKHQLCLSSVFQVERLRVGSGFLRCKSDLPITEDERGDSSNDLDDSSKHSGDNSIQSSKEIESNSGGLVPSMTRKFKLFEKSEEELILDYREELLAQENIIATDWSSEGVNFPYREKQSKFDDINLERGEKEVIDIEELVALLRHENMADIFVLSLPRKLRYTDYMLIASAKSTKHLSAVADFLVRLWKLKKHSNDPFLQVEGDDSPDWKTIDMRTIMVHLFISETREKYDLESLWSLGAQFDDLTQKPTPDPTVDLLEKHLEYLKGLKPAEPPVRRADMIPVHVRPGTMTRAQIKELQKELIKSKSTSKEETL